jgi:phage gpG-like protein
MTAPVVRIVGADRLARTLRRAATDIADQSPLNARTASALAAGMRSRAPRRRGVLAASIQPDSGPDFARAGTGLLYGAVQEYGSPPRHLQAQPFARPTLDDQGDDYRQDLAEAIQDDLDRVRGA